ncbi:MAG: hypothetical protein Kow0065_20450 [Methylomicrobium sp.]
MQIPLDDGSVLGNYRIERLLGEGGFALTYLAVHTALAHRVAIKEYFPSGLAQRDGHSSEVRPVGPGQDRFYREGLQRFLQ